eukprot:2343167-Rhodomonas_salina.1
MALLVAGMTLRVTKLPHRGTEPACLSPDAPGPCKWHVHADRVRTALPSPPTSFLCHVRYEHNVSALQVARTRY